LPFTPPQALMIGAWPLLFCLSMVYQQRLSPPMTDRTQEIMQKTFPYIVTLMLAHFSVGLVIYWTWSNVLGALQQYYIQKQMGSKDVSLIRGHAERRKKKPVKKADE
jgi:YidC/Oxa1 family membrane protein insertase